MGKRKCRTAIVPNDQHGANDSLYRLGNTRREMTTIEKEFDTAVADLRKKADLRLEPLARQKKELELGLEIYANENRETLLDGATKTVRLTAGFFGWRWTPTKVSVGRKGEEKIIALLEKLKLAKYIRVKKTLDKEALLKDRPEVSGIRYTQKEEFFWETEPAFGEEATNVVAFPTSQAA